MFITAVGSQQLARRVPVGIVAAAGTVLAGPASRSSLQTTSRHLNYPGQVLPGFLVAGVCIGLALPSIIASAIRDLAPHQAATGSAVVTMAGQTGSVLGVSLLVIFVASKTSADPHHDFAVAWAQRGEPATPPAAG